MNRRRIDLLDSFRALAVISVMLYHFTFIWNKELPGGGCYGNLFKYAFLGVQLFFVISGFVISYTLENTPNIASFWKNRFIRLFPPLLLCTLITYTVAAFWDIRDLFAFAHRPANLLPSLTLTSPSIWSILTGRHFAFVNGSYWTLWVEIQFYLIASILYFFSKRNFLRNLLLMSIALGCVKIMPHVLKTYIPLPVYNAWKVTDEIFNIDFFMAWFSLGVIFYHVYKGMPVWRIPFINLLVLAALLFLYIDPFVPVKWQMHVLVVLFFGLLCWKSQYLAFLDFPLFRRIGRTSYSLYLIHEVAGMILYLRSGPAFSWSPLLPLLIIVLAILFGELSWRFYERPVTGWLKRKMFKRPVPAPPAAETALP